MREIRFRVIVLVFNVVIVLSFLFVFLLPLVFMGPSYFSLLLSTNWIAAALFVVALASVNGYFAANSKLFGLLEREDWPGLVTHLENEVYRKGRLRAKHLRLLANAYLVTASRESTRKLEAEVRAKRPALMRVLAVPFGIPHLVAAGTDEPERYFAEMAAHKRVRGRAWLTWNHAFCLCRRGERETAGRRLEEVLAMRPHPVLHLLSLYLLATACSDKPEYARRAEEGRKELARRYSAPRWRAVTERSRSDVQALVLSKVIDDATVWLHAGEEREAKSAPAQAQNPDT